MENNVARSWCVYIYLVLSDSSSYGLYIFSLARLGIPLSNAFGVFGVCLG